MVITPPSIVRARVCVCVCVLAVHTGQYQKVRFRKPACKLVVRRARMCPLVRSERNTSSLEVGDWVMCKGDPCLRVGSRMALAPTHVRGGINAPGHEMSSNLANGDFLSRTLLGTSLFD